MTAEPSGKPSRPIVPRPSVHGGLFGPPRLYPLAFVPGDERFSEQLVTSMAALLVAHGYPPLDNTEDWAGFETALATFLFHHDQERSRA